MYSRFPCWSTRYEALACGFATVVMAWPASAQLSAAEDRNQSLEIWQEAARLLGDLRLTYEYQQAPTPEFMNRALRAHENEKNKSVLDIISSIASRKEGVLQVSRKGASLDREETLERFENEERVWTFTPGIENPYPATPDTSGSYIKIHGDGIYFTHSYERKTGAIWSEWDRRVTYPVLSVLPPNPKTVSLKSANQSGTVLDFVTRDNDLIRYELDPASAMMPIRIEYYDILEDGQLFLYRCFTVEKYIETENGAFLPAESTVHDFARRNEDGTIESDLEKKFLMTAYEENVQFDEDEFTYEFPHGTRVTNNILGTRYEVGSLLN